MSGSKISADFENTYSENRLYVIVDTGIDPNAPAQIFNGYLAPGDRTGALTLWAPDDIYGSVQYQRSDGAVTVQANITDGSVIRMS